MNPDEYYIYVVESDDLKAIDREFKSESEAVYQRRSAFNERFGATGAVVRNEYVIGITVPAKAIPDGWGIVKDFRCSKPSEKAIRPLQKTKAGKALAKELLSLTLPSAGSLAKKLGAPDVHQITGPALGSSHGMRMIFTSAGHIGKDIILLVPQNKESHPVAPAIPGCRLLKTSEFYAMKESVEAKAGAA